MPIAPTHVSLLSTYPEGWATGVALPAILVVFLLLVVAVVKLSKALRRPAPKPSAGRGRVAPRGSSGPKPAADTADSSVEADHRPTKKLTTEQVIIATLLGDPDY